MNHSDIQTQMADYLEGDLALGKRALFDAHLDACEECSSELEAMRRTIGLLHRLPAPPPPSDLADSVMRRIAEGEGQPRLVDRMSRWFGELNAFVAAPHFAVPATALAAGLLVVLVTSDRGFSNLLPRTDPPAERAARASNGSVDERPARPPIKLQIDTPVAPVAALQAELLARASSDTRTIRLGMRGSSPGEDELSASAVSRRGASDATLAFASAQSGGPPEVQTPRTRDEWLDVLIEQPAVFALEHSELSLVEQELWVTHLSRRALELGRLEEVLAALRGATDPAATSLADAFAVSLPTEGSRGRRSPGRDDLDRPPRGGTGSGGPAALRSAIASGVTQDGVALRHGSAGSSAGFAAPIVALLLLASSLAPAFGQTGYYDDADEIETVDLIPESRASFGLRNIEAGLASIFRGRRHYYETHVVLVETTPPDAFLDLFYVRSNFQKRFEQAESPVRVLLPARVETSDQDSLTIRAFAEGYRMQIVTLRADTTQRRVVVDLEPLPNSLELLSHQYFADRTSLTFLMKEQLTFRLQEAEEGISLILTETARSRDAKATLDSVVRSPIVDEMMGEQLGEDLLVQITYTAEAIDRQVEMRSRESYDVARGLHVFTIDLLPRNGLGETVAKAHAALSRLSDRDVSGCALEFDATLRSLLDPAESARALTPSGSFTDPYLRAAMRRLGEVSPNGVVSFGGGVQYDPAVPIELEAALSQAAAAVGYFALLRRFVAEFEPDEFRLEALRSLVAPELGLTRFKSFVDAAEKNERACLAAP